MKPAIDASENVQTAPDMPTLAIACNQLQPLQIRIDAAGSGRETGLKAPERGERGAQPRRTVRRRAFSCRARQL